MARTLILLTICLFAKIESQNLGTFSEVYPVEEESLLDLIHKKLRALSKEDYDSFMLDIQSQIEGAIRSPKAVPLIREASKYQATYFDPSIYLHEDIHDLDGKLLMKKGEKVNPLYSTSMKQSLLFFDGSKESHCKWALEKEEESKWILVKGRPLDLEERFSRPVYFDQGGVLCKQLSIVSVPCRVSQEGYLLKIEEIPLKEERS
ncbi:MAG: type-F conjugative transfer system protein TraW [Waddliaceae bacterium]|nr:type-F conjugative transfer system protein TraW [Waddliaceae bacterium]